jgi:hypothetical protein
MAQISNVSKLSRLKNGVYENYAENLAISTTGVFVNQLDVDCRASKIIDIIIHNDGAGDLDYRILANIKQIGDITPPVVSDTINRSNGWIMLSTDSIATTTVPKEYKIADNIYSKVIVQVKHTTTPTPTNIYFRGTRGQ